MPPFTPYNPTVIKPSDSCLAKYNFKLSKGFGKRDDIDINEFGGDYQIYACFKILERDDTCGFHAFRTSGTSSCLSLYSMVQGIYHITAFAKDCEISEDWDQITSDKVLRLPIDYNIAAKLIEEKLIGKTLRVIARSAKNTTKYGTRYYIFAIED